MRTIWKYPLALTDVQHLEIPGLITFLSGVHKVRDDVGVYAVVDQSETELRSYEVRIIGTGHDIKVSLQNYQYLGTIVLGNGLFVYHYFVSRLPEE